MKASKLAALATVALTLLAVSAAFSVPVVLDSQLTGTLGTLDLHAEANLTGTVWHYSYGLHYTQSNQGGIAKTFQVENQYQNPYTNAANTGNFANPTYNALDFSIDWLNGTMSPGQTVTFSYDSTFAPVTMSAALIVDAGQSAHGETLGLSIPEPASVAALGLLLAGALMRVRRRR